MVFGEVGWVKCVQHVASLAAQPLTVILHWQVVTLVKAPLR